MSYAALLALATLGGGHGCYGGEVVYVSSCYGSCYSGCYGSCYGGCYGETRRHRGPIRAVLGAIFGGRDDPCEIVHSCYGGCYGSCYGACYGASYSTTYEAAKPIAEPELAPIPDEAIPVPEAESAQEATPQARRTAPARRTVRRVFNRRHTVVSAKPARRVRRSTRVAQPMKTVRHPVSKAQVARARAAKAATQARMVAARNVAKREAVVAAKPARKPKAAKVARTSKTVVSAPVAPRRSLHGVAFAGNLRKKPARKAKRFVSPPVLKQTAATSTVQSGTPQIAEAPGEERKETARKSQPKSATGLAWYQLTKQTAAAPEVASPIRQVSFRAQPTVDEQVAAQDGKKLSVRVAKRGRFRAARDRRSRVAHYVAQLPK